MSPMNREQRRDAARRARRIAAMGSATILAASGASIVSGSLLNPAGAAPITVTNLNGTGPGSLYAALGAANSGDVISFQAGLAGTILMTKDNPIINQDITIQGPGPGVITINGQDKYHPFQFRHDGASTISGLTITHGYSNDANNDNSGGAIALYGADNGDVGSLTISNMVLTANNAENDGGAVWCAGYYSEGEGQYVAGPVTIVDSTISGNHAGGGGGALYTDDCDANILRTTISGNSSDNDGGGLYLDDEVEGSVVRDSTISGNTANDPNPNYSANGGGVFMNDVTLTIQNSTISGNTAEDEGGGIYQDDGELTLVQTTITANTGQTVGGLASDQTGAAAVPNVEAKGDTEKETLQKTNETTRDTVGAQQGNLTALIGTILAGNAGLDLRGSGSAGEIRSTNSLLGIVDPSTVVHDQGGTLTGANPMLGPLADNGGPTMTHALLEGSPAIDTGPVPTPTFPDNEFDQRFTGFPRVINGRVDIGAFEFVLVVRFTG